MLCLHKGRNDPEDLEGGGLPVLGRRLYDGGDGGVVFHTGLRPVSAVWLSIPSPFLRPLSPLWIFMSWASLSLLPLTFFTSSPRPLFPLSPCVT